MYTVFLLNQFLVCLIMPQQNNNIHYILSVLSARCKEPKALYIVTQNRTMIYIFILLQTLEPHT